MLIYSRAPCSSYFYMSSEGEPKEPSVKVEVTPPAPEPEPAPTGPTHAEHAELVAELAVIRQQIEAIPEDVKEWHKAEIQALLSRLENLEATATEGLTNLASQVTAMQEKLAALSAPKLPEPQPGELPETPESPPKVPPAGDSPPGEGGDGQKGAVTEQTPAPHKPSKRVV